MNEVKLKVEVTDGFERRYTQAVLEAYQRKANRENRTICGIFHPNRGRGNISDNGRIWENTQDDSDSNICLKAFTDDVK